MADDDEIEIAREETFGARFSIERLAELRTVVVHLG
jgi:hypothetical protein